MSGDSDKREEGEITATPPPPPKRRRALAMEVGNDFALPSTTKQESALQARINELEAELAAERRKRRDCERALEDIRRECRHPFVVPAIFDAVLAVSKLTNQLQK
ncbi:hypothetical protein BDZ89DRAFT_1072395 [Hymenopellis radicata]|nr:hypothetical protein BDZ89DRAFT_1072395 [Hymenopellis radicata]